MELRTTGENINSWFDLDEANLIIQDVPFSAYAGTEPQTFEGDDIANILEAQQTISNSWYFSGERTDFLQKLAWPRTGYRLQGSGSYAGWFGDTYPHLDESWSPLAHHIAWDLGAARYTELSSTLVPQDIKEAACILAMLRKNGKDIHSDNKGDQTQYQIGSLSGDNINAVAEAAAVLQRMARWGVALNVSKAVGTRG